MPVRSVWSKVAMAVQSALSAAQDVSAVSKANPAVVTYVGADTFTNGNYVLLSQVPGMSQVNERIFRVANVNTAANTLELEGEDSTLYDTFSGTAKIQLLTFGTNLQIVRGVQSGGGEPREIDATLVHDEDEQIEFGVLSRSSFTLECIWDPADAGLKALKAASQIKADRGVLITFANGYKHVFYGKVAASGDPTGNAQELVTTSVSITRRGRPTFYAT
jgi:hypothetical protein